mgnify:FL=1
MKFYIYKTDSGYAFIKNNFTFTIGLWKVKNNSPLKPFKHKVTNTMRYTCIMKTEI